MAADEITNKVLLEHIQAYGSRFDSIDLRFDKMEKRFDKKLDGVEQRLTNRIDQVERKIDLLQVGMDNLHSTVMHIEGEELPAIKQHVGMA